MTVHQPGWTDSDAPLLRVATMPVVLRAILTARRAGIRKFLVVLHSRAGSQIRRKLEADRRLPAGVEWLILPEGEVSAAATLREIAERADERFLLLPGDAIFDSRLLEKILPLNGQCAAAALAVSGQPAGIYLFPQHAARWVAKHAPPALRTFHDLHRWMKQEQLLDIVEADEALWQPITGMEDLPKAETKLNQWLFKETDGIYARLNRRISIPISRLLIKSPITPNAVTLFTMAVSLASGVFYGVGGYVGGLVGALLSYWASILDGVDGEVARLTFQESPFGCWLETAGDYLSYVFVFAGMAIGQARTSRSAVYPITGVLLLVGTVLSMVTLMYQRKFSTRNRPDTFGSKWQKQMDANAENLIYRFARVHHFLLRRAFLPYAFLFFALINFTQFVVFVSALGANLTWIITLYSNRIFRGESVKRTSAKFEEIPATVEAKK